jgi:hypothetical protein
MPDATTKFSTTTQLMLIWIWCQPLMVLFIRLIIRIFQLVFSAGTVFFSHNQSANGVFQPAYQHSRTGPISRCSLQRQSSFWLLWHQQLFFQHHVGNCVRVSYSKNVYSCQFGTTAWQGNQIARGGPPLPLRCASKVATPFFYYPPIKKIRE